MNSKAIIKKLIEAGWYELKGKKTSHRQFKHPERAGKITVPKSKDLHPKTVKTIERQSDVKLT